MHYKLLIGPQVPGQPKVCVFFQVLDCPEHVGIQQMVTELWRLIPSNGASPDWLVQVFRGYYRKEEARWDRMLLAFAADVDEPEKFETSSPGDSHKTRTKVAIKQLFFDENMTELIVQERFLL